MALAITRENVGSKIAGELIAELSAELGPRYGDDGSGNFSPDSVRLPRAGFVIAWTDEMAVGCGALRPTDVETIAEIKRMFVRRRARGRGISRLILHALEFIASDYGYTTVILETGIYQAAAINLYESSGYERTACYGPYVNNPLSICYQKHLRTAIRTGPA